jgi:hypothetical protein
MDGEGATIKPVVDRPNPGTGPGIRPGTCGYISGRVDPLWPAPSTFPPRGYLSRRAASPIDSELRETGQEVDDLDSRLARLEAPQPAPFDPPSPPRCALHSPPAASEAASAATSAMLDSASASTARCVQRRTAMMI